MTKLDRASRKGKELEELDRFYQSNNINSSTDLFEILKQVRKLKKNQTHYCLYIMLKMEQTSPSCRDLVMDCTWLGLPDPCMDYFSFLPTDDGICCTFNGASNYSDPELGIQSK